MNDDIEKKVSIITVCYNEQENIKKTLESVLNQQSNQFEYVVKDGESSDKTNEIIKQYEIKFINKGISFKHIIGRDMGIYDAMNKAVQSCTGEYLLFLNAGDLLCHQMVINKVIKEIESVNADIFYGDALMEEEGRKMLFRADMSLISKRMPFSHQACFINRERFEEIKYDTNYKICADYDLILKLFENHNRFKNVDSIICTYNMNGISSTKFVPKRKEHEKILKEHKLSNSRFLSVIYILEAYIKTIIQRIIPDSILYKLKNWYKVNIKHYHYWDGVMY